MARKAARAKTPMSRTGNRWGTAGTAGGFTLLELILVLVVISMVATITYPSMSRGRSAFHLRAVGRDVISTFRVARETAVTEQKVMKVSIDSGAQKMTLSDDVGDGARSYQLPHDVTVLVLTNTGEPWVQGPLEFRFLPNGSSDAGRIQLKSENGAVLSIEIDPILGVAKLLSDRGGTAR